MALVRHSGRKTSEDVPEEPGRTELPINNTIRNKNRRRKKQRQIPDFKYMDHVGMVGKGSGIYLGNGYVLTSAHVGCYPFRMSDGSTYKPSYDSWRVLKNPDGGKSDLAVFKVDTGGADTTLGKLSSLPVGDVTADLDRSGEDETPMIMIGTGFVEREVSATASTNDMIPGYTVQPKREKRWGTNSEARLLDKPVTTAGGLNTSCFVTSFDAIDGEAQAADGDSGGAMFAYNEASGQWELVGCIIAVSQKGAHVSYGAQTFLGNLESYRSELAGVISGGTNLPGGTMSVKSGLANDASTLPPTS